MNFYDSIIDGAQELPEQERGQLYTAVLEYLYYGREPDFKMRPTPRGMFVMLRPVLDNQRAKQAAGSKGGRAAGERKARRGNRNASKTQAEPKQNASTAASETQAERKQEPSGTQAELFPKTQAERKQNATEQEQEQEREKPSPDGEGKKSPPKRKQPRPFVPPTVGEVARVARERNLTLVDPEAFWAHYDAQGWVNGNGIPLVSWESKLISWNSAERLRRQAQGTEGAYDATYD